MTVQTILSRKGRSVVTIEPSATLQAAIATLAEHRIGAVVVLGADRRVIGLLSERDIVRAFAEFGADALTKRLAGLNCPMVIYFDSESDRGSDSRQDPED
jgi:CBS domain-containing protein